MQVQDAYDELGLGAVPIVEGDAAVDPDVVQMGKIITRISRAISSYCNRSFGYVDAVETFDDMQSLSLPLTLTCFPVTQVVSLEIDTDWYNPLVNGGPPIYVDPMRYSFDGNSGILTLPGRWGDDPCYPPRRIIVTYSGGYLMPGQEAPIGAPTPPPVPDDLVQGALEGIKALYFSRGAGQARDPSVQTETTTGVGSTTYFPVGGASGSVGILPGSCVSMIDFYRRSNI